MNFRSRDQIDVKGGNDLGRGACLAGGFAARSDRDGCCGNNWYTRAELIGKVLRHVGHLVSALSDVPSPRTFRAERDVDDKTRNTLVTEENLARAFRQAMFSELVAPSRGR
jgi:hypothetical protein